ncbi:hypothetical protein TZ00_11265 [Agreia bicolorata]|uniref:DUF559 domain-containing protein n=1 Tax=Agreia bicolorata TaxID=110935 RepID=A0ABR5CF00_9MICO|nr:hypothetical protein TZ00_11265 [Agreia bicolorata]
MPSGLDGRAFSVRDALDLGVSPGRLRRRDLAAPFHGVRMPAVVGSPDLWSRCRAYAARMPRGQFYSHLTAAAMHGLPVPRRFDAGSLHVSTISPAQSPRAAGIIGHRLSPGAADIGSLRRLPVVSILDAWCQCATLLSIDELVITGDHIIGDRYPQKTGEQLWQAVECRKGSRGVRSLVAAAELIRPGSESPKETELRLLLIRGGLPEPELNVDVFGKSGRFIGRGDLVYRGHKVLVEYDGSQHADDRRQFRRDVDRLEDFAADDWRVVRVLKEHMNADRADIVTRVRNALTSQGWRP